MAELRAPDLRFSLAEAEALLNGAMRLDLSGQEVAGLQERTEGWTAGLQLAALTIQQQRAHEASFSLPGLREDGRHLADYLASEVLQRQPAWLRAFLLQTSILETLDASLCDAVTGQATSQAALEALYSRNLFVTALDRRGQYRYHRLFADFLRARAQQDLAADLPMLHMRAAAWYEQHGPLDQAIEHTLAAGRVAEASRLIHRTARQHLMRGEASTVLGWFRALPDEVIRSQPLFCLMYAWVLTNSGQAAAAIPYLDYLEATVQDGEDADLLLGEAASVRARLATMQGDPARRAHYSQRALALLPEAASLLRSDALLDLAFAHKDSLNSDAAEAAFLESIRLGRSTGNMRATMLSVYYLAETYLASGRALQAARLYQQGLEWCRQATPPSALACWAHAGLGALLYEWNDLPEAGSNLRRAIALGRQSGEPKVLMYARISLAHLLQTEGRPDEALATLDAAAEIAEQTRITQLVSQINLARARIWLRQGRMDALAAWLQQHGLSIEDEALSPEELTALAWFHLAQSQAGQTPPSTELGRIVERVRARCEAAAAANLAWHRVPDLIILALAQLALGHGEEALAHMAAAVAAAEPMGLLRTFADWGGPAVGGLLRRLAGRQRGSSYLGRLLSTLDAGRPAAEAAGSATPAVADRPPVEPLHPREVEVLRHIAHGRSNQEIAREMVLALSTVKWYLRSLYSKLGVSRRTQALAKARALGLFPPD